MHTTPMSSDVFSRLNELHLSKSERLCAIGYLHDGEHIAAFFSGALAGVAAAGHAVSSLAHSLKALFARPARH